MVSESWRIGMHATLSGFGLLRRTDAVVHTILPAIPSDRISISMVDRKNGEMTDA
jgi:hypothetical protein